MPNGTLRRQAGLRTALAALGLETIVVTGAANIRYLTGFTGTSGLVLLTAERTVLVTDFRYATQAPSEVGEAGEVRVERTNLWDGVRQALAAERTTRVAVDRGRTTLADVDQLKAFGAELIPVADLVGQLRVAKDEGEVDAIRQAAVLAAEALAAVQGAITVGRTELAIAADLEAELRRRGSEWHPFQSIVASGPRSALPHARSTARPIQAGDLLVLDFGAQVSGYCSDITRTFVVGAKADERQRTVYETVRLAQLRAREGLRAGLTGREADSLARDPIARAGMGEAFGHSLGHGLGLDVHEAPRLSQTSEARLPVGAVVTVEPGVYFEGWGGVRIEDDVVLLEDRAVCLSDGMTDLVELT